MNAAVLAEAAVTSEPAIAALLAHAGPVLLDFDETLYLRNSTEDFVDSVRPAILALLVMRLMDFIRPWRWTGGDATRDVWRVRVIMILFPWTIRQWERRVAALLATEAANRPLIDAVKTRARQAGCQAPVIVTLGFRPIVAPLVASLGLSDLRIISPSLKTFAERRDGKLRLAVRAVGNECVRRALVLTDSADDEPLLAVCAIPLHTEWPEARFRTAFSDRYLPGQYLSQVKRPGERYISRGILQEDFALWVLSSVALATHPLAHVVALVFLLVSFWSIYERGYVDNDAMAARFEKEPKLSKAFREAPVATPRFLPWIWAAATGAIAAVLLRGVTPAAVLAFALWMAVLLATHGTFALYNRIDKSTRVWLYSTLQLARSAAFVAIVPITAIGAIAIGAHVLAKWVPYYIYRVGGRHWPDECHFMPRLLFFVTLTALLGFAGGFAPFATLTTAALLIWNIFRARHELLRLFVGARRIDRDLPQSTMGEQRK